MWRHRLADLALNVALRRWCLLNRSGEAALGFDEADTAEQMGSVIDGRIRAILGR